MIFNTVEEFKSTFTYESLEALSTEDLINTLNHLLAVGGLQEGETYFEGVSKDMFGQSSKISNLLRDKGIGKKRNGAFFLKEQENQLKTINDFSIEDLDKLMELKVLQVLERQNTKKNYIFIDNDLYDCETKKTTIQLSSELHNLIMSVQKDFKHTNMNLLINQAVKEFMINHNYLTENIEPEQEG